MTMRILNTKPHSYTGLERVNIGNFGSQKENLTLNNRKYSIYNQLPNRDDKCGNKTMKFVNSFEDLVFAAFCESDKEYRGENNLGFRKKKHIFDFDDACIQKKEDEETISHKDTIQKCKNFNYGSSVERDVLFRPSSKVGNTKIIYSELRRFDEESYLNETDKNSFTNSLTSKQAELNLNKKPKAGILYEPSKKPKIKKRVTIVENFYDGYFHPLSSSVFVNELKSHPIVKCNYYLNDYETKIYVYFN
jgi:hypothetical protein